MQMNHSIIIEELVWRKGTERCERTERYSNTIIDTNNAETSSTEKKALPVTDFNDMNNMNAVLNKRETANAKINERYLIGQATQNPFMPNNNYSKDIEVQMNFLIPQKS
jgi:hypothetical protein